jgi:RimJ/RimL family protein N-acetyltransferase
MLAITRDVWEGHDYVPRVWQSWLRDHRGILLVAEIGGEIAGFQHVAVHPDRTAWLEGIRVREQMQGAGVGSTLLAAGIEWARFNVLEGVRLSTASANPASNRMAEKAGFRAVARFESVRVSAGNNRERRARPARPDEFDEVRGALGDTCYYTEGWTAYRLTDDRLRLLLATNQVLVAGRDGPSAIGIATSTPQRLEPRLGLLHGTIEGMTEVLVAVGEAAGQVSAEWSRGQLEISDHDLAQLERHGLDRAWEHHMVLWELLSLDRAPTVLPAP